MPSKQEREITSRFRLPPIAQNVDDSSSCLKDIYGQILRFVYHLQHARLAQPGQERRSYKAEANSITGVQIPHLVHREVAGSSPAVEHINLQIRCGKRSSVGQSARNGKLAQWFSSISFTPRGSGVRIPHFPLRRSQVRILPVPIGSCSSVGRAPNLFREYRFESCLVLRSHSKSQWIELRNSLSSEGDINPRYNCTIKSGVLRCSSVVQSALAERERSVVRIHSSIQIYTASFA